MMVGTSVCTPGFDIACDARTYAMLMTSDYKAVSALCEATANIATGEARTGCMMAAAVLGQSQWVA
jgi:hypothetical protein